MWEFSKYTFGEEVANSITHGVGTLLGVLMFVLFFRNYPVTFANVFCFSVYGVSLIVLYLVSAIYHALKVNGAKMVFRKLDHCSIFLLIAGTYTPISVLLIRGKLGVIVLSCIWSLAILGIVLNSISVEKFAKFSFFCYLGMGWAAVTILQPLIRNLTKHQLFCFFSGGIAYTVGAVIYLLGKKVRYMHSVWHLFVLTGSTAHVLIFF
jgi:hemolysin III